MTMMLTMMTMMMTMIYPFPVNGSKPRGGGNCSVPDIINTLGGGPVVIKTLTIMVGNCGGLTSYMRKTLTIMVGNCGGVTSYLRKTLTIMVGNCGGVTLYMCKTLTTMVVNCNCSCFEKNALKSIILNLFSIQSIILIVVQFNSIFISLLLYVDHVYRITKKRWHYQRF